MKNIIIGILLVAIAVLVLYVIPKPTAAPTTNNNPVVVNDFQSCVAAGNQILDTDPAQCKTADGQTFTEAVQTADVIVSSPTVAQIVTSPLTVTAKVRGTWFNEANLPIELQDENGKVLAQKGYMTTDNWMTTDYVNVNTTLSFKAPTTDYGKLVIKKDNPSGDPARDQSFEVPVRFK